MAQGHPTTPPEHVRALQLVLRRHVRGQDWVIEFAASAAQRAFGRTLNEHELEDAARVELLGYGSAGPEVMAGPELMALSHALLNFGLNFLAAYAFYLFQKNWLEHGKKDASFSEAAHRPGDETEDQVSQFVDSHLPLLERCLNRPLTDEEHRQLASELTTSLLRADDAFYRDIVRKLSAGLANPRLDD